MEYIIIPAILFVLSFLAGMMGLGVAFILTPVLGLFGFDLKHVIMPWSLWLNGLTALAGAITYARAKMVDWRTAIPLLIIATVAPLALHAGRLLIVDLRKAAGETQRAMAQTTSTLETLQAEAAGTARRLDASATHIDDQLLIAGGELRTSREAVQRSLDRLNDPRTALFGPERSRLGPGERLP